MGWLARESTVGRGAFLLVAAVGIFWFSGMQYRAAQRQYAQAAGAPVADYVMTGWREVTVGSGRSRHQEQLLQLQLSTAHPGAPERTELRVTDDVIEHSHNGDHWRARVVGGELRFDPALTGVERQSRMWRQLLALLLALSGGWVLRDALRKRAG